MRKLRIETKDNDYKIRSLVNFSCSLMKHQQLKSEPFRHSLFFLKKNNATVIIKTKKKEIED